MSVLHNLTAEMPHNPQWYQCSLQDTSSAPLSWVCMVHYLVPEKATITTTIFRISNLLLSWPATITQHHSSFSQETKITNEETRTANKGSNRPEPEPLASELVSMRGSTSTGYRAFISVIWLHRLPWSICISILLSSICSDSAPGSVTAVLHRSVFRELQ